MAHQNRPKSNVQPADPVSQGADDSKAGSEGVGRTGGSGPGLKARAVRLLSLREHSRKELARKLSVQAPDQDRLEQVLDELEREGWQSDHRFVQSFERTNLERYGSVRIAMAMRERGVGEELVRESLERMKETETERAWTVWNKRYGQQGLPADPKAYAKHARFLAARGFSGEVVSKILSGRFEGPEQD